MLVIFYIGRQKNFFSPVYKLSTTFYNVSGLQVGNNIRFLGINVGTVDNIIIKNDSLVTVEMLIKTEVVPFIKEDSKVSISNEGLIGDRIMIISHGGQNARSIENGQSLSSTERVEMDAIISSLEITAANAEIITGQLAEIMIKINNGSGTLGRLLQDKSIADNLSQTILNLKKSAIGLNENMEAAKSNFFLRGFFKKKEAAAEKLKKEAEQKKLNAPPKTVKIKK
jgi:phospholipid/cholesterol/gamma-HCH transport system substrate-binding protein